MPSLPPLGTPGGENQHICDWTHHHQQGTHDLVNTGPGTPINNNPERDLHIRDLSSALA